jgi:hypothetical protein
MEYAGCGSSWATMARPMAMMVATMPSTLSRSARSRPAEVEGLVLGQVRRLLASPELVARTITAVRREKGAAEDLVLQESEIVEALSALEPVWDELYPAEQARILRLLIERIDVAPDGISVTLHAAGIRSLVAELADQQAPALAASEPRAGDSRVMTEGVGLEVDTLTIRILIPLRRRGGRAQTRP